MFSFLFLAIYLMETPWIFFSLFFSLNITKKIILRTIIARFERKYVAQKYHEKVKLHNWWLFEDLRQIFTKPQNRMNKIEKY
jgi:hypothetical protein